MEVRCPQCEQRLRYSDTLQNPTLRCRSCGTTFRAADAAASLPLGVVELPVEQSRETPEEFGQIPPLQPKKDESRSDRGGGGYAKSGMGTVGIVVMLIALKVGLRLVREFTRERPAPPPVRKIQLEQEDQRPHGLLER